MRSFCNDFVDNIHKKMIWWGMLSSRKWIRSAYRKFITSDRQTICYTKADQKVS